MLSDGMPAGKNAVVSITDEKWSAVLRSLQETSGRFAELVCAVTDARIPLDELKYWSVDLQEAYAQPVAVLQRHYPAALKRQA